MTAVAQSTLGGDHIPVPAAALVAAQAADDKQGESTAVLTMSGTLGVTDAFVITSGRNSRQVRTIMDEVEKQVKESFGRSPLSVEGRDDFGWVLMDYGEFIVHVFLEDRREYYDLERLWADAPRIDWASTRGGGGGAGAGANDGSEQRDAEEVAEG